MFLLTFRLNAYSLQAFCLLYGGCKYECECENIGCFMLVMIKTQVLGYVLTVHVMLAALIIRLNDGRQDICR